LSRLHIPASLQLLLSNIICSNSNDSIGDPQLRRVNSIASDIVYASTSGRIKMPQHVLLPYGVKVLTGNVELIHMLNRLGHGIAYSQLLEIETAVAMQWQDRGQCVPENIMPNVFTTLAWDNIDKCEETLTGDGTTHRVNGIAIQRATDNATHRKPLQAVVRTRQRSFQCVSLPLSTDTAVDWVAPELC